MSKFNDAIKFNGGMRICEASIAELKFIDAGFCHILHFPIIPIAIMDCPCLKVCAHGK